MKKFTQAEFIREYNDKHREEFNPILFQRDDYEVIEALKKVILSCQRDKYFTIRVDNFRVVEDYDEIVKILYNHEQEKINRNKNNSKRMENIYQYVNLKDSDIMLLIIDYYIAVNDNEDNPSDTLQVILEIPRIVDKYYYRIGGSLYSAIYQIVDGSTYNNSTSNSKFPSVTLKTMFMPTRLYRYNYEVTEYNGSKVKYITYSSRIFNKNIPVIIYFLAQFGMYGTIDFFGLKHINITDFHIDDPDCYTFEKNNIFISVPKLIFDNDIPTQCVLMTIYKHIFRNTTLEEMKTRDYWLGILSLNFTTKQVPEKGYTILDSLESIYDIDTYETIKTTEDNKKDIYSIIRWMIREFPRLRLKDNIDISTKRIRRAEYIAHMYAIKMSKGIHRASDIQKRITVDAIKRYIYVEPSYLINRIVKNKLTGFKDTVNDNDAMVALKYSYKGISGLGEQRGSSIPDKYRRVHHSHIGRVDLDASSNSDPGVIGIICPLAKISNRSFSDQMEPDEWHDEFDTLLHRYRTSVGSKELVMFQQELGDIFNILDADVKLDNLDSTIDQHRTAIEAMSKVDKNSELFDGEIVDDNLIIYKT